MTVATGIKDAFLYIVPVLIAIYYMASQLIDTELRNIFYLSPVLILFIINSGAKWRHTSHISILQSIVWLSIVVILGLSFWIYYSKYKWEVKQVYDIIKAGIYFFASVEFLFSVLGNLLFNDCSDRLRELIIVKMTVDLGWFAAGTWAAAGKINGGDSNL